MRLGVARLPPLAHEPGPPRDPAAPGRADGKRHLPGHLQRRFSSHSGVADRSSRACAFRAALGLGCWQAWVLNLVMPFALVLLALGLGIANPFSLGGARGARFDTSHPGIIGLTRHPVLWALVIWAAAHIPPNGDLAHALLFGPFAATGLAGMRLLDARRRRTIGETQWHEAWQAAQFGPLATSGTTWRIVAGLVTWPLLLALHPVVIGVPALIH